MDVWQRGRSVGAQFLDQDALILRIVDRRRHQMHAAARERGFERGREPVGALHAAALRAIRLCVADEVRVAEGHAEIREPVHRLLPADHAVGAVLDDEHHEIELEAHRRLELLRVHHEAAIAAHRQHARFGWSIAAIIADGRPAPIVASALSSSSVLATCGAVVAREPDLVHAVVEADDPVLRHHLAHVVDDPLRRRREAAFLRPVGDAARGCPRASGRSACASAASSSRSAKQRQARARCRR